MNLNWTPSGRERLNTATSAMMDLIEAQGVRRGDPAWVLRREQRLAKKERGSTADVRINLEPVEPEEIK